MKKFMTASTIAAGTLTAFFGAAEAALPVADALPSGGGAIETADESGVIVTASNSPASLP